MSAYEEQRLRELLDRLADTLTGEVLTGEVNPWKDAAYRVGAAQYLVWEARKLMQMPDRADLQPVVEET